jgi:aspartate dehydrogenase
MQRIGIIGYGTAGREVARALIEQSIEQSKLVSILVRDLSRYESPSATVQMTDHFEAFMSHDPDVVVETAGHEAVHLYGETILKQGKRLMLSSVGALGDQKLFDRLWSAAVTHGGQIICPSAAIAGLDRLAAAKEDGLETVELVTRKPIKAWHGTYAEQVVDLHQVTRPVEIFCGNARESSQLFPESVNVSAAISLAGIGFEKTRVRVIVDPTIDKNIHELNASGKFGSMKLSVSNTPSPNNPKTGYIVAMSLCKAIRQMNSPLIYGL